MNEDPEETAALRFRPAAGPSRSWEDEQGRPRLIGALEIEGAPRGFFLLLIDEPPLPGDLVFDGTRILSREEYYAPCEGVEVTRVDLGVVGVTEVFAEMRSRVSLPVPYEPEKS